MRPIVQHLTWYYRKFSKETRTHSPYHEIWFRLLKACFSRVNIDPITALQRSFEYISDCCKDSGGQTQTLGKSCIHQEGKPFNIEKGIFWLPFQNKPEDRWNSFIERHVFGFLMRTTKIVTLGYLNLNWFKFKT